MERGDKEAATEDLLLNTKVKINKMKIIK